MHRFGTKADRRGTAGRGAGRPAMATNADRRDNGTDSRIDYEQIARREKALALRSLHAERGTPAVEEFLHALEHGENEREAYFRMVSRLVEFLTVSHDHLDDLGEFDRSDPSDYLLARSIDVAGCTADGRHDLAEMYTADVVDAIDELQEASDDDVADALGECGVNVDV